MGQCSQQVKIPGTQPPASRPCSFKAAPGEAKCARHGGRSIRPRRRSWGSRLKQAWKALVG